MTLTEFLLARIAKDEAIARRAIDPHRPGSHWRWMNTETDAPLGPDDFRASLRTVEEYPTTSGVGDLPAFPLGYVELDETYALPHIARHDPARVLAECAAKRRIVERHKPYHRVHYDRSEGAHKVTGQGCEWCGVDYDAKVIAWPCPDLLDLAAVYADHPDCNEAWHA